MPILLSAPYLINYLIVHLTGWINQKCISNIVAAFTKNVKEILEVKNDPHIRDNNLMSGNDEGRQYLCLWPYYLKCRICQLWQDFIKTWQTCVKNCFLLMDLLFGHLLLVIKELIQFLKRKKGKKMANNTAVMPLNFSVYLMIQRWYLQNQNSNWYQNK